MDGFDALFFDLRLEDFVLLIMVYILKGFVHLPLHSLGSHEHALVSCSAVYRTQVFVIRVEIERVIYRFFFLVVSLVRCNFLVSFGLLRELTCLFRRFDLFDRNYATHGYRLRLVLANYRQSLKSLVGKFQQSRMLFFYVMKLWIQRILTFEPLQPAM